MTREHHRAECECYACLADDRIAELGEHLQTRSWNYEKEIDRLNELGTKMAEVCAEQDAEIDRLRETLEWCCDCPTYKRRWEEARKILPKRKQK